LVIRSKKKENLTETDLNAALENAELAKNQGDRWTFAGVLPESSYVVATQTGERTLEQANTFIATIKAKSDGQAPFFTSDCWYYEQSLVDNYCTWEEVPYKGRGRRPLPKQVVDPNLRYAQVHKKRDSKGKIEEVSTRIVLGDEREILLLLLEAERCKTINTVFIESRNGKYRKDDARLIRKTLCHSKKAIYHDAHIIFLTQVMNYTRTNDDLKIEINPNAELFEQKYQHRTPAMAEGLIDKKLTIKELLTRRPQLIYKL
jgi:IS1 family transposase